MLTLLYKHPSDNDVATALLYKCHMTTFYQYMGGAAHYKQGCKNPVFKSPTRWVLSSFVFWGVKPSFSLKRPNLIGSGICMGFQLLE